MAEPFTAARFVLQSLRIVNGLAQHLEATADADHLAAVAQMALQVVIPALLFQPGEVGAYVLAAGEDHQIGGWCCFIGRNEFHCDAGMVAQGIEIGVVADPRQDRDNDVHGCTSVAAVGFTR